MEREQFSERNGNVPNTVSALQVSVGGELPNKQALEALLKEIFGEGFTLDSDESYALLNNYLQRNKEQNERLAQALQEDPNLGQLFVDVVDGKRSSHSALARYFGRDFFDVDEDSPEYEEMLEAEEERRKEALELARSRKEYEDNLEASQPIIDTFCKERGYDRGEFMDEVWNGFVFPILSGRYTQELCAALEKAINYDTDVQDAFAAGDVKGRNTNIRMLKENRGDGMPKGLSGGVAEEMPRRRNGLIESALKA